MVGWKNEEVDKDDGGSINFSEYKPMKYRSLCVGKVSPPWTVIGKVLAIRTNFKRTLSFLGPEVKDSCPVLALADGYNEGGLGIKERSAEKRF
ncbi:hypothetical protein SADUNF_Sadunf12G0045000 [Salix dunnii]|uniref:Uncharacterized protein n=1 Tax=Salix dunnii TaxID=1413687 RepID=A0A835JKJ6_9ROSI|nr:hypothetical protein SADUNF_Sadunf12G0045000 [Salix dunnii]